jgi:hypothetical protein
MIIKTPSEDSSHPAVPEHIRLQLNARRIEFITTAIVCVVFAICFAHLVYQRSSFANFEWQSAE